MGLVVQRLRKPSLLPWKRVRRLRKGLRKRIVFGRRLCRLVIF